MPGSIQIDEEDEDELLVRTPGFPAMITRSRASLQSGATLAAQQLLAEAEAALAKEQGSSKRGKP